MLLDIGLIALGFVAGVLVTGTIACLIFGLLHAEAVRAVEGYGFMLFSSHDDCRVAVGKGVWS
ncbi:hypothetical protein [Citromicrobium sp. WPS32]|uniref:hypothetical protein n=1 Tax=Citromicrobium sp. WPS32 TaxID=1634517 RepID=UPI0006C93378|nr:hypothetical protein [Citromicrobium sp. WPS32]KPM12512.1 hypothetical protein WG75_14225 [Citromicrobium sp. WPS32]MAY76210.1 hypothetical protein [Citromicrobium sp.]|tara:strand:- start:115 stop:303 length:189 start_codon:yes stop_codon:yes gene_type:complete